MSWILIVGAKSDIAKAIAIQYAKNGYNLFLAGRNIEELKGFKKNLEIRYDIKVKLKEIDILDFYSHGIFYESLDPKPEGVITAVGYLPDQKEVEKNIEETLKTINTNYTGLVTLLNIIANDFERKEKGFIIGISSVAGDRGRATNYIYGSAKAGFSAYLSGLRNRLYKKNVQVLTVKPGFVRTKMTEGMDLPEKLTATPEEIAKDIYSAQQRGKDILYTLWKWKYIMLIIKLIPEKIFKKLNI